MKSLTQRNDLVIGADVYNLCHENCLRYGDCYDSTECVSALVARLGPYEDAEENGQLLMLPCKVGTSLWEVKYNGNAYYAWPFEFDMTDGQHFIEVLSDSERNTGLYYKGLALRKIPFSAFGKTVFLSEEEAEAAATKLHTKTGE